MNAPQVFSLLVFAPEVFYSLVYDYALHPYFRSMTSYNTPCYIPPVSEDDHIWMTNLEKSLINASKETMDLVLMGDFNIDLLVKKKCRKLIDITDSFQLQHLIKIPPRISEKTETLIDHIYVTNCDKVLTSEVLP